MQRFLIEQKGLESSSVKVGWKAGIVKVKGKEVTTVRGVGKVEATGEAERLANEVEEEVEDWYAERVAIFGGLRCQCLLPAPSRMHLL